MTVHRHAVRMRVVIAEDDALLREGLVLLLGNGAIAELLVITETAVSKHIFAKLGLPPSDTGHRRVLAVLAYLRS